MPLKLNISSIHYILALIFCCSFLHAQQKPIAELVEYTASKEVQFNYAPFSISNDFDQYDLVSQYVSAATVLDFNNQILNDLIDKKPNYISLQIPSHAGTYVLDLVKKTPLNADFKVVESHNPSSPVDYQPGVYYRGIVRNNLNSIVAISFFENDIIGVMSTDQHGNMILGKVDSESAESTSNKFVFYQENNMKDANPFVCGSDNLPDYSQDIDEIVSAPSSASCKTVSVYIEADNLLYRDKGRTTKNTTNYISGLFNIVATLYENEQVNTDIKTVFVWTTNDPYSKTSAPQALGLFGSRNRDNFDGDIAHLFSRSRNGLGGLAWVDVLCKSYNPSNNFGRFAFSNIGNTYSNFPTYSWTTMVVTHEMGHNLGSHHTHRCVWGPNNNEALDNCVTTEGGCAPGPRPNGGGTIMSYCHLTSSGINFRRGFGPEPGDLIRSRIENANCLGSTFDADVSPDAEQIVYYGESLLLKATPTGSKYTYKWFRNNHEISGETTSELNVSSHGSYYAEVSTHCSVVSNVVDVTNREFIASINYPALSGDRDSVSFSVHDTIESQESQSLMIDVPMDILNNIPPSSINYFVRLTTNYRGGYPTELRLLELGVDGSQNSNISIPDYNPSANESAFRRNKTYVLNLGQVDPAGTWTFNFKNNNTIDREKPIIVTMTLELIWIGPGQPSPENISLCEINDLELNPNLPGATYEWSTGETTETIIVNEPGTYSVSATKGNLFSQDDIIVSQYQSEFMISETICANDFFEFGTQTLTKSGTYMIELISSKACDSNVTLELTVLPEIITQNEDSICFGGEYKGEKYFENSIVDEIFIAKNGCDSILRTSLAVFPEILIDQDIIIGCQDVGSSIHVSSINGETYSYLWEDGFEGEMRQNIKQKSIELVVKNEQNCEIIVPVEINHFDSIAIDATTEPTICFDDTSGKVEITALSGTSPFIYTWNDGSNLSSRSDLPAGMHTLNIIDSNQCSWTGSFEITSPDEIQALFDISPETQQGMDGRIQINPTGGISPYTYLWNDGDTNKIRENLIAGDYSVTITDFNGCKKIFVVELHNNTASSNIPDLLNFSINPNPSSDLFHIDIAFNNPRQYSLSLHSLNGTVIHLNTYSDNNLLKEVWSVESLSSGVYFAKLITNQGIKVKKLVVK